MVAMSHSNDFNSWSLLPKYFFSPLTLQWYLVQTSSEWTLQFWAAQDQAAVVRADCWCCLRSLRYCSCCPYVVIGASTSFCLWRLVAQTNCVFVNESVCMFQFQRNIRFLTFLTSYLIFVLDSQTKNSGAEGLWSDVVLRDIWEGSDSFCPLVVSALCKQPFFWSLHAAQNVLASSVTPPTLWETRWRRQNRWPAPIFQGYGNQKRGSILGQSSNLFALMLMLCSSWLSSVSWQGCRFSSLTSLAAPSWGRVKLIQEINEDERGADWRTLRIFNHSPV